MLYKRRFIAAMLTVLLLIPAQLIYANPARRTDDFIFSDPVSNIFTGHREGAQLVSNLRFTDLPGDPAAQDAIVRSGAYNLIKGSAPLFRPGAYMTVQEAISFALRAAGNEAAALAAGNAEPLPYGATAADRLYIGYLALARNLGLITADQFTNAFMPIGLEYGMIEDDMGFNFDIEIFRRTDPATREQFAHWLALAVNNRNAAAFNIAGPATQHQSIYAYTDWNQISPERLISIEQLTRSGVMSGNNNRFRPREYITRMEAAWAGRALDSIFHNIAGFERFYGTVGGIVDAQAITSHTGELWREIRVRRIDGQIDVLRFTVMVGGSPQIGAQDAVVLKNGAVGGLGILDVGDPIEYIVHPATGTVIYAVVTGGFARRNAMGRLQAVNVEAGTATFFDEDNRAHTYALAQGLLRVNEDGVNELRLRTRWIAINQLPLGSFFAIDLMNNLIAEIEFAGNFPIDPVTWGVVIANNPMLGYLVIWDAHGFERTFNYNVGELQVQKSEHYDMRNTIGGFHALFPNLRVNHRDTSMGAIEPGNIVSFRTDPADPTMIINIHATTNYTTRYGRIREFRRDGNMNSFLMEFENGRTSWFDMPENIMIRRDGRIINAHQVHPGDWARILVNQAIIGPGHVMEAVKAMNLEGDARHISNIVRGQLTAINMVQNQLVLQNAQQLGQTGWQNYRQMAQYNITGQQIEYFYNGRPVSLGFVNEFLRHSTAEAYIALENAHGGERIRKVSFRGGRDELLNPDTVVGVDGHGSFHILSADGPIRTDEGTIVRRNGRLVDGRQIFPWDHAVIALNGGNNAAVVDIGTAPGFAGVQIARGRVQSIDQGRSFRVQSMALFDGLDWHFTPIEREFAIDHSTLFMIGGMTPMNINEFIDFNATHPDYLTVIDNYPYPDIIVNTPSRVDQVFNIVIDGSRAAKVTDARYATRAIRGIIYGIDGNTIHLRNVHYRETPPLAPPVLTPPTQPGTWRLISNVSATATADVQSNSIIVDRNQVVGINSLQVGQQVRIMTANPAFPAIASGMHLSHAYIVMVER